MNKTSWARARELVGSLLPFLPENRALSFGPFTFNGTNGRFSYQFFTGAGDNGGLCMVIADFKEDGGERSDELRALGLITEERTNYLLEDAIYSERALCSRKFPTFSYHWRKTEERGRSVGILHFLRIDFSDDDFINYEGEDLKRVFKMGREEYFAVLPEKLSGIKSILRTEIPHRIDFEKAASLILKRSSLEIFSRVCHATYS